MNRLDWWFHIGGGIVTAAIAVVLYLTGVLSGDGAAAMICTGIGWAIHATAGDTISRARENRNR